MATTAIWDVRDNLKRVLDYCANPSKTTNIDFSEYAYQGLDNVLEYTAQDLKTEKQLYVSCLNCEPETVSSEMISTKIRFQKEGGILAYHAYQSFAPNEVSAETAHQIGIEFAQTMWGDRFEVQVSTHLDKKHFHNHFVINSVSFIDGKRYKDNKSNYRQMRILSDSLCKKYDLSVIKSPKKSSWHYAEWQANKQNKPTERSLICDDVDLAISQSMTYSQFLNKLKEMGYKVKTHVKYTAVCPPGKTNYFRLYKLKSDGSYDEEHIKARILENKTVRYESLQPQVNVKRFVLKGDLSKQRKLTGFRALYFKYMYMMGILPQNRASNKRVHFLLREDLRYMDQITKETTLLCKQKIDTIDQLDYKENMAKYQLDSYIKERRCIYNKIRRCRNPATKQLYQKDVASLSADIKELRKEVMLYEGIRKRSVTMKEKLHQIYEQERQEQKQPFRKQETMKGV